MVSLKLTHNYIGTMALFEIFVKGCPVYSWNLVKTAGTQWTVVLYLKFGHSEKAPKI